MDKIAEKCCGSCESFVINFDGNYICGGYEGDNYKENGEICDSYNPRNPIDNPLKEELNVAIKVIECQEDKIDELLKIKQAWEELKINYKPDITLMFQMNQIEKERGIE